MRHVIFYNARRNKWRRAPDMLRKRHWFASCVINDCLYVAGGKCGDIQRTVRSAEVYDPNQNRWSFISEMNPSMMPFIDVVHNGTWFLKEIGSDHSVTCEAYSPETDTWIPVSNGMVNGWHDPCISLNGQLYVVDCRDGCKLTVYDTSWKKFIDSKLHLGSSHALSVVALVSLNGKLCIVRNNMSISLVDISSPNKQVESNPHLWENIGGEKVTSGLWLETYGQL